MMIQGRCTCDVTSSRCPSSSCQHSMDSRLAVCITYVVLLTSSALPFAFATALRAVVSAVSDRVD